MNVLIICPRIGLADMGGSCPLGALAIATYLNKCGHTVKIFDRFSDRKQSYKAFAKEFKPDIIGISLLFQKDIHDAQGISSYFYRQKIPVVWGGIFPSTIPEVILKEDYVDFVVIGEGEKTWEELLDHYERDQNYESIKGLAYKENMAIRVNPPREFIDGKSLLPLDFSLIDVNKHTLSISNVGNNTIWIYASKGCPNRCTFCLNQSFNHCKYRSCSGEKYLTEIAYLLQNTQVNGISFCDDNFAISKTDIEKRCREITESGLEFKWMCQMNVGVADEDDYKRMYECGCRMILFGIESGSPQMLKRIKKPFRDPDGLKEELQKCSNAGIMPYATFIIGLPDETEEDVRYTIKAISDIASISTFECFQYVPYLGSEMSNQLIESNKIKPIQSLDEISTSYWSTKLYRNHNNNFSKLTQHEINVIQSYVVLWGVISRRQKKSQSVLLSMWDGFLDFIKFDKNNFLSLQKIEMFFSLAFTCAKLLICILFGRKVAAKYNLKLHI